MDAPYVHADTDPSVASELREADEPMAESTVWVFPSIGLGGGSARLGPIVAAASFDGHAFLTPHVSLGIRGGVLSAGAPDGNGDATRAVIGMVGYRWTLSTGTAHEGLVTHEARAPEGRPGFALRMTYLHLAAGAGWIGLKGYTQRGTNRKDYEESAVVLDGRGSVVWTFGAFLTALGIDVLGAPGQGFAVVPNIGVGIGF